MGKQTNNRGHFLSGLELFSGVPDSILAAVEKECTWHHLTVSEVVIDSRSHRPHGVFFLIEGQVEVLKRGPDNRPARIATLSAPECFGEFGAITGETGSASVKTKTVCLLAQISAERFMNLLNACPFASLHLLKKVVSLVKNLGEDSALLQSADNALETAHRKAVLRSL